MVQSLFRSQSELPAKYTATAPHSLQQHTWPFKFWTQPPPYSPRHTTFHTSLRLYMLFSLPGSHLPFFLGLKTQQYVTFSVKWDPSRLTQPLHHLFAHSFVYSSLLQKHTCEQTTQEKHFVNCRGLTTGQLLVPDELVNSSSGENHPLCSSRSRRHWFLLSSLEMFSEIDKLCLELQWYQLQALQTLSPDVLSFTAAPKWFRTITCLLEKEGYTGPQSGRWLDFSHVNEWHKIGK